MNLEQIYRKLDAAVETHRDSRDMGHWLTTYDPGAGDRPASTALIHSTPLDARGQCGDQDPRRIWERCGGHALLALAGVADPTLQFQVPPGCGWSYSLSSDSEGTGHYLHLFTIREEPRCEACKTPLPAVKGVVCGYCGKRVCDRCAQRVLDCGYGSRVCAGCVHQNRLRIEQTRPAAAPPHRR